jgi:hypothetical protein
MDFSDGAAIFLSRPSMTTAPHSLPMMSIDGTCNAPFGVRQAETSTTDPQTVHRRSAGGNQRPEARVCRDVPACTAARSSEGATRYFPEAASLFPDDRSQGLERAKGIEPSYAAWEAAVLPLNYARKINYLSLFMFRFGTFVARGSLRRKVAYRFLFGN